MKSPAPAIPIEVAQTVERVARDSYGRLVAFLAARSRDVAGAEDALADAFQSALETWPRTGLPEKPEAWLLVAARHRLIDKARHGKVHALSVPLMLAAADEAQDMVDHDTAFPDERLKLMFVCAHPAIDAAARTPLMLQCVLGLDAARIASAFLVKPATMGQRLSRAKTKIRDAGIAFEVPSAKELAQRLDAVLEAIYAIYGAGWEDVAGADTRLKGLASEGIVLGRVLLQLMPADPEVKGLLALMLYCEARKPARLDAGGAYVPLSEQDPARWTWPMIVEANALLVDAQHAREIGHFQLEAAIQSVHARRGVTGQTDWEEIALLYEGIVRIAPTAGARVGHAAAIAHARGPAAALVLLEAMSEPWSQSYQPYWALAAHLYRRLERIGEARDAYARAIGLCENAPMRVYLIEQAASLCMH
ncbi:MAG TPA: DUF6596 domain-containing protein [Pararobbsia sp.]|nr:DUF6596 domain-containing protein [Pararobbsia sp.]